MAPAPTDEFPRPFGPFTLLDLLGKGGMGAAYLAKHPDVKPLLVVKRMHEQLLDDETAFRRFVHEAQVATLVSSANLAALIAVGTVGREPFFATEYVLGLSAVSVIDALEDGIAEPMPIGVALYLGMDLVKGLRAIHEMVDPDDGTPLGLIHRDIGSRNVIIGVDGVLRVIDLGLGKSILSEWETAADVVAGSPDYMAPEQVYGEHVDDRADIYGAGVVIWELLAGRKRIRGGGLVERLDRAARAKPEPLVSVREGISESLERILQQAMAPEPEERTPSASIFLELLEQELHRLNEPVHREDVVGWLSLCFRDRVAELKTKLAYAERIARQHVEPVSEKTEILVAHPIIFVPNKAVPRAESHWTPPPSEDDPTRIHEAHLEPEPVVDEHPTSPIELRPKGDGTKKLNELVKSLVEDPKMLYTAIFAATLCFVVVGVLVLRTISRVSEAPNVTPMAELPQPPLVAPPPLPKPEPVEKVKEDTGPAEEDVARRIAQAKAEKPAAEILARRRALAKRLKRLRKVRFDVVWQRKLTRLGSSLSRASSSAELDRIEARLRSLERGAESR